MPTGQILTLILALVISACGRTSLLNLQEADPARLSTSCAQYKGLVSGAADGEYELNLDDDPETSLQKIDCDFTGGDWSKVEASSLSPLETLRQYGDTTDIESTFYTDPVLGFGWGGWAATGGANPIPTQMKCFTFSKIKNISRIKVTLSWGNDGNYGYLFMGNHIDTNLYSNWGTFWPLFAESGAYGSMDAWGGGVPRNWVTLINPAPTADVTLYDAISAPIVPQTTERDYVSNGNFEICMGGENNTYNRRFIKDLSFK